MNEAKADDGELARIEAAAATPPGAPTKDRATPRDCGHFDIHIDRDGSWFYRGTPINRASLVKLFSTVLERDAEGVYWLVTPAERGRITVDDAPFLAVELERSGEGAAQELSFRTNLGDFVTADAVHPLRSQPTRLQTRRGPISWFEIGWKRGSPGRYSMVWWIGALRSGSARPSGSGYGAKGHSSRWIRRRSPADACRYSRAARRPRRRPARQRLGRARQYPRRGARAAGRARGRLVCRADPALRRSRRSRGTNLAAGRPYRARGRRSARPRRCARRKKRSASAAIMSRPPAGSIPGSPAPVSR